MSDLFGMDTDAAVEAPVDAAVDFYNLYAQRRLGRSAAWGWFKLERLGAPPKFDGGVLVEGAVAPIATKGKGKGFPSWKDRDRTTELKFVISEAELNAIRSEWEHETGKCSNCYGRGQEWAGWSKAEGTRYRPCHKCKSTGAAKVAA